MKSGLKENCRARTAGHWQQASAQPQHRRNGRSPRLTLKDTDTQLEALVCPRPGGLPKATKSKIEGDRADLMNCLMETLWNYMSKVQGVPNETLVDQFILGLQSYDWESHLYAMS
ncbi:hypothetical protein HDU87_000656 [Geranomyces variabilis]|uniref:Uncharacterized protein n=1 Tax=Geranomyces variabilis TaxID=109894 RepID=A0AAD5THF5_9FUNG|nr:hypothetical protein HDU87_000656 [Geranomyces variabilis]